MRFMARAAVGAACLVAVGAAAPAFAATTGTTTTTFTITGGALAITVPASATLGTTSAGATLTGQLGNVTVNDARAALNATWTTTASTTDFQTGGGTANEKVLKAAVSYASGVASATTGFGVFTPGQLTPLLAASMAAPVTAYSFSGVGSSTATWNPTIVVAVPAGSVAGTYTGTVTHSVA